MISGQRGQAIVEFALIMPILMLILLGIGEITFLAAWGHNSQQTADVLADVAASRMTPDNESWRSGWTPIAADEIERAGCESVDVTFPDGTHRYGDRVRVRLACTYHWHLTDALGGIPQHFEAEAVVRTPIPTPAPSSAASVNP